MSRIDRERSDNACTVWRKLARLALTPSVSRATSIISLHDSSASARLCVVLCVTVPVRSAMPSMADVTVSLLAKIWSVSSC